MVEIEINLKQNRVTVIADSGYMYDNALFGVLDYTDYDKFEDKWYIHMPLDKFMSAIQKSAIKSAEI
jgi:hypothetical protein